MYVSITTVIFINTRWQVMSYWWLTLVWIPAPILELPVDFPFSFGDFLEDEISNSSKICERWYRPSSLFMVVPLFFLISTASFTHLLNLSCSVPITFASPHPMTWLCSTTWSVMADLCTVLSDSFLPALVVTVLLTLLTSALCSSRRVPNFLPVSPM